MHNTYSFFPPTGCPKSPRETKYSVPLYKAKSGFLILAEECLTFETVSSTNQCYMIYRIRKTDT